MGQNSRREHFLMSATKCDSWTTLVREIESIEHARKTITAPTPMGLDAFQGNCHKCGEYGHTAKECRSSSHGGAEKPQCAQCGKKHHGQCWVRSCASSHQDSQKGEDGEETEKETASETRKVEKTETVGKEKVEERRKRTTSQRKYTATRSYSGEVDPGNIGPNNLGTRR